MKQYCKFYKNYNLKECWETNSKGKELYRIKFTYYKPTKKYKAAVKTITDSNGWVRTYYKNGNLKKEVNPEDRGLTSLIGMLRRSPFWLEMDYNNMFF